MTKKKENPKKAGRPKTNNHQIYGRVDSETFETLPKPHAQTVKMVIEAFCKSNEVRNEVIKFYENEDDEKD